MSTDSTGGDVEPKGRQFDDRQVALILETAAELQHRDGGDGGDGGARGLTLAELEQIATEAGLDPAMVRRAVSQLDGESASARHNAFLGGAAELVVERSVAGEVREAGFEEMLATIRTSTGDLGETSTVGRLFGWRGRVGQSPGEVSVVPDGGRTTVRVRVNLEDVALVTFMVRGVLGGLAGGFATLGATGVALASAGAPDLVIGPVAALVGASVAALGYLSARRTFARHARAALAAARALADRIAARADAPAAERSADTEGR